MGACTHLWEQRDLASNANLEGPKEQDMKRLLAILCSLALAGGIFSSSAYTYDAEAAEISRDGYEISGNDAETANENKDGKDTNSENADGSIDGEDMPDFLSEEDREWITQARTSLSGILKDRIVMALVYLSDQYPVRESADYDSAVVAEVPSGQQVQIQDIVVDDQYEVWEYVLFYYQGKQYTGYIPRTYLACSDEVFLEWETEYGMNPAAWSIMSLDGEAAQSYQDIEQFPASYQAALTALKEAHPNWTFVKMNTNLDWNVVVQNEMVRGRNLIPSSFPEYMWDGLYSSGWAYVTEDSLKYYLDPRNGLTEEWIFQFEQLTYNESYHTEAAVQAFLNNTFMSGGIPDLQLTYAHAFYAIGKELGVSPFHLACRVYQEQGQGTSALISGTYPGYEGYYNYFNIGASGSTTEAVIVSGLERAKKEGWSDRYQSIYGGSRILSSNYILHGQDTLYLQKFDVDNSYDGMYWHQYMQNICAPTSEGSNIRKSYEKAGSLDNTFVFKIPVYNNMPEAACARPTVSYTIALSAPEGYTDPAIYLDGIAYQAAFYDNRYFVDAPDGNARTAIMYKYNENGVPVGMYVWELSHNGRTYQATAVPELENLLSYHGFSVRITGKSGIRFKTGISADLRNQLIQSGAAGYVLKEYGTLVMNNANRAQYPLIKGGEKVLSGLSYGINESGALEDKIYETVDGRYRFTSVLVGLPVTQYKTEFAFRGYIVLTKNGQDITLYGPTVWRSIYTLAQQVLGLGQYAEGSEADQFLKQLISDADSIQTQQ